MFDVAQAVALYKEGKSTVEIAEQMSTYPNKVRRALKKSGVEIRDHESAIKVAKENGTYKHPMQGRTHDEATKARIGDSMMSAWEKRERKKLKTQIAKHRDKAIKGNLRASREGSSIELFLLRELSALKYNVLFHKKHFVMG